MPHLDASLFSFRHVFLRDGESRFARPVAAITCIARQMQERLAWVLHGNPAQAAPRARIDRVVRTQDERFAGAVDHADVERIARAFDRREPEGMRRWD